MRVAVRVLPRLRSCLQEARLVGLAPVLSPRLQAALGRLGTASRERQNHASHVDP